MSKAHKPAPSSSATTAKYSGAFGDHLQSDIIYIRLLTGKAVPVIGMVCTSTNYHAAKTLDSREPQHVLETMHEIWYRPFGLPLSIQLDADGAYMSVNQEWHQNIGIQYDIIPSEEAWRLGKIGRRNGLMRTLSERLIDQNGAITRKQLDEILTAVLFSMNTSTYTYGRSPCQAVFGRIPRPVGDLISDPKALTTTTQLRPEQTGLQPELLRAEALSALARFSAAQAVRRALLRKTPTQQDLSSLEAGQAIAYWRQTGRARQHKRGAWNLGRFLAWDPDRKSAWIQVGNHTNKVGSNQLRRAAGWEQWTPSTEDMQLIRQAEHNITDRLWSDHTTDPPGTEMTGTIEDEIFEHQPAKWRRLDSPPEYAAAADAATAEQTEWDYETSAYAGQASSTPYDLATLPRMPETPATSNTYQQSTSVEQHMLHQQMNQQQTNIQHDNRQINVHIDSPTYQNFGPSADFGRLPPTPRSARARSRTPTKARHIHYEQEQRPAASTTPLVQPPPALGIEHVADQTEQSGQQETAAAASSDNTLAEAATAATETTTPHVSGQETFLVAFDLYDDGTARPKTYWDGSPDIRSPLAPSTRAYEAYLATPTRKADLAKSKLTDARPAR